MTVETAAEGRGAWADVGAAIGRIPSGLFVLATRAAEADRAILVSWVQQAAFSPPSITVCLRQDRPVVEAVRAHGYFALSVLGEDQADLVARFARGTAPGEDPFHELFIERTASGCAVLQEAVAALACRVRAECDAGDHVIILGEVVGGRLQRDVKPWVHLRKDGLRY